MKVPVPKNILHFFINVLMDKDSNEADYYNNESAIDVNQMLNFNKLQSII